MAVSKPEHLPAEETPNVPQYPANQPYSPPAYQPGGQPGYQGQYPVGVPVQPPVITHQPAVTNTTVVVNQQQMVVQKPPRNWSTGLCGCFEDCGSCKYVAEGHQALIMFGGVGRQECKM